MYRCIQLAKNGLGTTYPNPLVGCVVVHDDKIIGEGWHYKAGLPHAEVNAIKSVENHGLLADSTLYVSLEPCSHFGKTPPCANLIVEKRIPRVVIGSNDPNPLVAGKGIEKLRKAGIQVMEGVAEKECLGLNKRFFTYHNQKRPYIFLKWAETVDRFMAPLPQRRSERAPVWITNVFSRQLAHKLRSQEMAILVGTQTALADNPGLNTREWAGNTPLRVAMDKNGVFPSNLRLLNGEFPTIIFSEKKMPDKENLSYISLDFSKNVVPKICEALYKKGIQSLIVEGGSRTLQGFIDSGLWDEALVFTGKKTFLNGVESPKFKGNLISEENIGSDRLSIFKNTSP